MGARLSRSGDLGAFGRMLSLALLAVLVVAGSAAAESPWSPSFTPPAWDASGAADDGFVLAPVDIGRNDLDYDAVMSNRPHLLTTLGLRYDFDHLMYENWRVLLEQADAFTARTSYAYTILEHPGRGRSLGAVYIDPPPAALAQDRSSGVDGGGNVAGGEIVHLSYWMAVRLVWLGWFG